ncbi:DUF1801 domain-containing protein [Cryobacterium sp. CG_9.6]|uniref:DUF1801 domain-containing protein n=1 Tax=Cryobacterium sp. CG_9.6 TaxID=2760710 RepID=UPI0024738E53|nr:DUF1801 domain-containing protein [Cryobacterium sp. CG_9.6]MDH6237323.1 hypothetical protein [Cryobacterium sp. CG_9.6]
MALFEAGPRPDPNEAIHLNSNAPLTPSATTATVSSAESTVPSAVPTLRPAVPAPTSIDEYLAGHADPIGAIAATLRAKFDAGLPQTSAQLWHGHPVWLQDGIPVAGFKAYASFVTVLFWRGQRVTDASGKLDASGAKEMGSVKLRVAEDVDAELFDDWLRQINALDPA